MGGQPRLAGIREPGLRKAGRRSSTGGGGTGGTAALTTIADAGGYFAPGDVEGALQVLGANDNALTTALGLRPLASDLASHAVNLGASMIGVQNATNWLGMGGTNLEGYLTSSMAVLDAVDQAGQAATTAAATALTNAATANTNALAAAATAGTALANAATANAGVATNATAIGLRPLTTDLASGAVGKGASLIALQDAGGYYPTDNVEAALQKLGPYTGGTMTLGAGQNGTIYLTDASAVTPDIFVVRHKTTAGSVAVGMGFTMAGEVWDSGGGSYRAWTDTTKLTNITGGTLAASRTFALMNGAGSGWVDVLTLSPGQLLTPAGTAALPVLAPSSASTYGLYWDAANTSWAISSAGSLAYRFGATGAAGAFYINAGNASISFSANGVSIGRNGGTGSLDFANTSAGYTFTTGAKNAWTFTPAAPGSNNTASTEAVGVDWALSRTSTWATGAIATQREFLIRAPTYAFAAASTITTAATLAVAGPPIAGAPNATITTPLSLWTQNGIVRHDISDATQTAPDVFGLRHMSSAAVAIGSGITSYVEIADSVGPTSYRAGEDTTTMTNVTGGTQASRRAFGLLLNNTMTKAGGFGFNSATYPMLYVGDPASNDGFRRVIAGTRIDLMLNNTVYWAFGSTSECFAHVMVDGNTTTVQRLYGSRATVASANVLTLGTANVNAVTGATTIKGIATASWTAGSRVSLELPSGITVNHNDGTMPTGGGVAILLRAAANLTTAAVYQLDLVFNGLLWIQPG